MKKCPSIFLVLVLALGACENSLDVSLSINDPCNQSILSSVEHIGVDISSQSNAGVRSGAIWKAGDRRGELPSLSLLSDALVSVVARDSDESGDPGDVVAASTVGVVDFAQLDSGSGTTKMNLVLGKTDTFFNTTVNASPNECSLLIAERHEHSATALGDGRVFLAGGVRQNVDTTTYWETTELYDPIAGVFRQAEPMAWMRRGHTASALDDGRVLLVGGLFYSTASDGDPDEQTWVVAHLFDSRAGDFKTPVKMLAARAYHTATKLADGRVLIIGGRFEGNALASSEIFDPATNTSVAGPTLSNARYNHVAIRIAASTVAVLGGHSENGALDSVEFLTAGDTLSVLASGRLAQARTHAVGALVGNAEALLIAGGFADTPTRPEMGQGIASIELFGINRSDLESSAGLCTGTEMAMNNSRGYSSAHEVEDGLLVIGGLDQSGTILKTAEILNVADLESCQISATPTRGSLSHARAGAVLSELIGGDVLVTGGVGFDGSRIVSVAQPEIYVVPR